MKPVLAIITVVALAVPAWGQAKKSVAVEEFDYSTVRTVVQSVFSTSVDIGRGISALMVNRIARGGKLTAVERGKINTVMKEQDFGASGRVKKGTQARIGQIRGADYTLFGDIVAFGRDDRSKSVVGGVIVPGAGGVGGVRSRDDKAVVVLAYRLVDNESSEIVATGEARGESKRTSKGGFAGLMIGPVFAGGAVNMAASNFAETIIGEAVMDACDKLGQILETQSSGINAAARDIEIEAKVADVTGTNVTITAGSAGGVTAGMRLQIGTGKVIKDPTSGEVLDTTFQAYGEIVITTVRERIAIGAFTGAGAPKVGDLVRNR
jgi:curli biogenesis system outer membrane secretion channel CsgG